MHCQTSLRLMPILLPKTTHFDRFSHARCVASTTRIIQNIWFLALSSVPLQYSSPPGPTPAVWPKGGTLSSIGGPCLSGASWPALLKLASVLSHEARWGVSGFGSFCLHNNGCALRDAPRSNLGCRGEPRQHRQALGHEGCGNMSAVFTNQGFVTNKPQDRFPKNILLL